MPTLPKLFDPALVRMRRAKAFERHGRDGSFLLDYVARDMEERLAMTLRPFPLCVEMGGLDGTMAPWLAQREGTQAVFCMEQDQGLVGTTWPGFVASQEALPLKAQSVHLILAPLVLHWINDLPGALYQIRNSLKPDGLFLGALLGNESLKELRTALLQADSELSGGATPRVAPFPELKDMGGLLQRAGFALPVADQDQITVRYDSMFALMQDLRKMGATNSLVARQKQATPRGLFLRAAEIYQNDFADDDGRIRTTFQILSLSGWAPHDSQQKPLKPGSATTPLSAALKDKSDT